jgi:hypothetical protein
MTELLTLKEQRKSIFRKAASSGAYARTRGPIKKQLDDAWVFRLWQLDDAWVFRLWQLDDAWVFRSWSDAGIRATAFTVPPPTTSTAYEKPWAWALRTARFSNR